MKKKLQVFVSSTYTDLIEERQCAVEAILSAGHIPAGMELFSAGNDSQLEVIKRWIDESDVYLLILGARYGSIEPVSKKSYTHLEYEYALKKKKPIFAIVMSDKAIDHKISIQGRSALELENQKEYASFKGKVLKKICKICDDNKDIQLGIFSSLQDIENRYTLTGWISGADMCAANEIFKQNTVLLKENERLKKENEKFRSKLEKLNNLNQGHTEEQIIEQLSTEKVIIPKKIVGRNQDVESNVLELFEVEQRKFAIGVTNKYGVDDYENFLFWRVAPKLMVYGLVQKNKVAGVSWQRIETTQKGFSLLSKLNNKVIV